MNSRLVHGGSNLDVQSGSIVWTFCVDVTRKKCGSFFAFPRMILHPPPYSCENHLKKQWLAQCLLWVITLGLFQNVETGATHCCHCSFPFPVLFPASVVGFALKLHLLTSFVRALYAVDCLGVRG